MMTITLSNITIVVGKQILNPAFTIIVRLSIKDYTTELSKDFWEAMNNEKDPRTEWSISANSNNCQPGATRCNLYLDGKLVILLANPLFMLNKRMEFTGKCRHENKFKLKNFCNFPRYQTCLFSLLMILLVHPLCLHYVTWRWEEIYLHLCSCASLIR